MMDPWLTPRGRSALLILIALGGALWLALLPGSKIPVFADEGQHLVGARHILLDPHFLLRHHRYVGGHQDWPLMARTYWTYPPTIDALYAGSLGAFGMGSLGLGLPLLAAALVTALSVGYAAARLAGGDTALVAVALLLWSRAAVDQGILIECEPFVAALGAVAVAAAIRGALGGRAAWFAAAGALLGAGFLFKLWLVFPAVLMVGGALLAGVLPREGWGGALAKGGLISLGFALVGGAHLVLIAVATPADLPLWREVYLGSLTRVAPAGEVQPLWYYGGVLYRDLCVLALPLLVAAASLLRPGRASVERRVLQGLGLATVASLALLTVAGRKESLYAYPLTPALVVLAAVGMRGIVSAAEGLSPTAWRGSLGLVAAASVGSAGLIAALGRVGAAPSILTPAFVVAHGAVMALAAAAMVAFGLWRSRPGALAAALVGLGALWGGIEAAGHLAEQRADPITPVATYFAGIQAATPPGPGDPRDAFVSTDWLPMSFYTWIRGRPWVDGGAASWEQIVTGLGEELRWFQIDKVYQPRLGAPPDPQTHARLVQWLRANLVDVTPEIEAQAGRPLSTWVFVRP